MSKDKIYIILLFLISLLGSFLPQSHMIGETIFFKALFIYWIFTVLSFHLRTISKKGNVTVDYGLNYSLSFILIFGPAGLIIFESLFRITAYFYKKVTKTDDPDEFLHIFYNIGSFVLQNTITFFVYIILNKPFSYLPFGFWILMFILVILNAILSDTFLTIIFYLMKEIRTKKELISFIKSRSILDLLRISFINGMLFLLIKEGLWEMVLGLFIINYLVGHSFISKAQLIQHKAERDQFEQMAYSDFLTGVHNRAYMDKKMKELKKCGEWIGIVVGDIDNFKRINDNYNHAVGDEVIRHFANTLKRYMEKDDYLFRSGGEEFTMFLRKKTYDETKLLLSKILLDIENSTLNPEFNGDITKIKYTSSMGLYFYKSNENVSMEKGYIYADQLMLQSKTNGRNRLTSQKNC
ncbi:GGDEF domain-containing protein [Bacillus sp. AFS076308]|uniref:GGDEF domain-containing protein n=1 Tax=unclassified Bacillus (in: firmicutes) TaxID=185979 RepID=UPI000BF8FF70|nr:MULTISPECIES: GGDEF domain-containing protein [unclassified Bacillus (in: firmicutes)]PFO06869.1 GGDEF domain-containing protein [Bacillus sp. AFS076308]PGV55292.1 GGDEF domain-containing protein [Bacillus sp. AFS037270]